MRQFYIIRHGQTDWNVKGILQGSVDTQLNETGRQQAKNAQAEFAQAGITMAIVSPKRRCLETLAILKKAHNIPHEIDMDLVERSFGDYEGQKRDDCTDQHTGRLPDLPSVEPWEDLKQRAQKAVETQLERYAEDVLCFVSHGGFTGALIEALTGQTEFKTPNSTLIKFTETCNGWSMTIPSQTTITNNYASTPRAFKR